MDINILRENFAAAFGADTAGLRFFHAPGRVNLIGEHTDYNGGYVFPCALSLGTYAAARRRADGHVRLVSGNMKFAVETDMACLAHDTAHGWANYPKSVAFMLREAGFDFGGFELYLLGDLPNGAGLSSSASVELVTAAALQALFGFDLDPVERARLCQRAENAYVGVNCGIMDQFASGMGRAAHAILLDCATLEYRYVPLRLGGCKLVIANTNKPHSLTTSKYNERRAECEEALRLLRTVTDAPNLCALTPEAFEAQKSVITDETVQKRAAHAVYENDRCKKAADALNTGDLAAFGRLMNASHVSLRDLYDVTGAELDALAEAAWDCAGVLGSRMTGAGFGGCTVSIVHGDAADAFRAEVGAAYTKKTGLTPSFYLAETGDGAREIGG